MLITPHLLTGAFIATYIPSPFLAIPLAVGSHFVLDSIPHWQEILYPYNVTWKTWVRIPLDFFVGAFLVSFIATGSSNLALIWICAISALLPDIDSIVCIWKSPLKIPLIKKFYDWHCKIQKETSSVWGLVPQIAIIILVLKTHGTIR